MPDERPAEEAVTASSPAATAAPPSDPDPSRHADDLPWPPSPALPVLEAFSRTWVESCLHPTEFFARVPRRVRLVDALLYFLPLGIAVAGIGLFWRSVIVMAGGEGAAERLGDPAGGDQLVDFLLSPLTLIVTWWVMSAVVHVLLAVFRGAQASFGVTLRVFAFSYGPILLAIVPGLGSVAGALWSLVLVVIGLRETHRTETWRPVVAMGCGLLIGAVVVSVFAVLGLLGMAVAKLVS